MTGNDAHRLVNLWLEAVLGVTVRAAYQNAPRPALPYVMTNRTGSAPLRDNARADAYDDDGTTATRSVVADHEWRFSVHAYGDDPESLLTKLHGAYLADLDDGLAPLVLHRVGSTEFAPDLVGEKWEPRAVVRIAVHGVLTHDAGEIDLIETAPFDIA